jgi:hypothetical protein
LEDKVVALEKELLNKAETEKRVVTLKTKVCQLEAQVAKCKAVEIEQEQEIHILNYKVRCTKDKLEDEKAFRMDLEDKILALENEFLNKAQTEEGVLKKQVCQLEAQVAEYKEREKAYEQERQLYLQTSSAGTYLVQNHVQEYIHDTVTWEEEEKEQEETLIQWQQERSDYYDQLCYNALLEVQEEIEDPHHNLKDASEAGSTNVGGQEALLQQNDKDLGNLKHELDDPYWLTGMNGNFS